MNFLGINPISMLYYSAVINGIIAPPLLIIIMFVANNKTIMKNETNGTLANSLGILTISIMSIAAFLLLVSIF
jgi:Mn2+/Fe2+ NRAMP family transporter